jgi:hypothetical protein
VTVPWSSITGVEVEHCTRKTDYSYTPKWDFANRIFPYYVPVIGLISPSTGGALPGERVIGPQSEATAHRLAEWLRDQIGR